MIIAQIKNVLRRFLPKERYVQIDDDLLTRFVAISLAPDATFVEIGTFTGAGGRQFCDLAHLSPNNCHLVEACPDNFEILKKNSPGYRVYNLALADRCGTLPFYVVNNPKDEGTSRSNSFDKAHLKKRWGKENVKEIQIRTVDMKTFIQENCITRIDYLFFNCEGAEYAILNGDLSFLDKVQFFHLDLHHRVADGHKAEQLRLYDLMVKLGFVHIGGHKRTDIPVVNNHLTFLWEKASSK